MKKISWNYWEILTIQWLRKSTKCVSCHLMQTPSVVNHIHYLRDFGGKASSFQGESFLIIFYKYQFELASWGRYFLVLLWRKIVFCSSTLICFRNLLRLIQIAKIGVIFSFQGLVSCIGIWVSLGLAILEASDISCTISLCYFYFLFTCISYSCFVYLCI